MTFNGKRESGIGKRVRFKGTTEGNQKGIVLDEIVVKEQESYELLVAQLIDFDLGYRSIRVAYWLPGKKASVRDKYVFGQYAPNFSIRAWRELVEHMQAKGWLTN